MSLRERISDDVKTALKSQDKLGLAVTRLIMSAIKQEEIDHQRGQSLDDTQVLAVLNKMVKQRRESFEQYQKAGREELASKEQSEIDLIQKYLPEQLSENELTSLIEEAITGAGASAISDMGQVMAAIKPKVMGRADMKQISTLIRQKLS